MKNIKYLKASFLVSVAIYLIGSFIMWDILWIYRIEWNIQSRIMVVVGLALKELIFYLVVSTHRIVHKD